VKIGGFRFVDYIALLLLETTQGDPEGAQLPNIEFEPKAFVAFVSL
jgi:hypothetical protein